MRINEAYEHEPILPYQSEESTVTCQGSPSVTCVTSSDKTHCTVTLTQQVCVSIPVCYGVTMSTGDPTIACADGGAGGCHCR